MKGAANAGRPRSRAGHGSADLDMQEIPPRHLAAYVRQVFHAADEAGVSCDLPVTRVLAVIFSTLDRACEQRNGSQDASNLDIAFQSTDSRGSPLLHVLLACDSRLCCAVLERYGAQLSARALWAWDCQGRTALAVAQLMGVHGRDVASRLVHLCQLPRSCVYPGACMIPPCTACLQDVSLQPTPTTALQCCLHQRQVTRVQAHCPRAPGAVLVTLSPIHRKAHPCAGLWSPALMQIASRLQRQRRPRRAQRRDQSLDVRHIRYVGIQGSWQLRHLPVLQLVCTSSLSQRRGSSVTHELFK